MVTKPQIESYGNEDKFNFKQFIIPGALLLLVVVGFIFASFDNEGERYQDLKTNEIQEKEMLVELGEEVSQNPYTGLEGLFEDMWIFVMVGFGITVMLSLSRVFMR